MSIVTTIGYSFVLRLRQILLLFRYEIRLLFKLNLYRFLRNLNIKSSIDSVNYIVHNECSVSRYGEGEFLVMGGSQNGFQEPNLKLAQRLKEVLEQPITGHVVGIPYSLKSRTPYKRTSQLFILEYLLLHGVNDLLPNIPLHRIYLDSLFTRFYMPYNNPLNLVNYMRLLKRIWDNKDILIIEGQYSRLGIGNNLFDNSKSIIRILGPEKNAFDQYDEILNMTKRYAEGHLVLLALGMTATVMAYDLAKAGFRAIDIGHIDIEYDWYCMKATHKCKIPNKMMSEVVDGKPNQFFCNELYESQIVGRIYDSENSK